MRLPRKRWGDFDSQVFSISEKTNTTKGPRGKTNTKFKNK